MKLGARNNDRLALCFLLFACFAVASPLLGQGYEIVAVARPGDPTPDDDLFLAAYSPSLNDSGQVAFAERLVGSRMGLYLYDQGKIATIARGGDPTDRCEGTLGFLGFPSLNAWGQIAFSGGFSRGSGIFFFDGSQIHAIVCPGDPAPGGSTFLQALTPTLNSSGQIAFYARLENRDEAVFFCDGSEIHRVAGTGDPAPGGGTFVRALWPSLNDQGQVVFEAEASAPARVGVFLYERGGLQPIVQAGDPTPEGGTFGGVYRPMINNPGQVAFGVVGTGGFVWMFDDGQLRRILPPVDPETGDQVVVSGPGSDYPHPFHFNDLGQIAFDGRRRPRDGKVFRPGLFFFDGEGFRNIVFSGDPRPGGGTFGDFHSLSLNTLGQLAFTTGYVLHNARGLFLASPPAGLEERTR